MHGYEIFVRVGLGTSNNTLDFGTKLEALAELGLNSMSAIYFADDITPCRHSEEHWRVAF